MKNLFYAVCSLVCLALFVACTEEAPSLIGQWKSEPVMNNDSSSNSSMVIDINLAQDSTMTFATKAVLDSKEKEISIHMPFTAGFKGTWTDDGDEMTWNVIDSTQYCKFEKDSIQLSFGNPTMEVFADKIIKSFIEIFEKEGTKQFLGGFEKAEPMDYILEGDLLKIVSDNDTILFHRQVVKK